MSVKSDNLTTYTGLATVVFGTLAGSGVQPQFFGLMAAIAHAVTSFYTNK
jgi:hypothetical protein